MAKGSMLMGTAGGKLGEMVLYRAYGQQVARAYVKNIKDAKSDGQIDQRAKFAITGAMFAASGIKFFPKRTKGTNYNEFLKKNVTNVKYWQSKQEIDFAKANGIAPYEDYILADGTMANLLGLAVSFNSQTNSIRAHITLEKSFYNRYLPLFEEGETTAQVSVAQIVRDYVTDRYGSMYVHPTIVGGELCQYDPLGVVGQADFLAFSYIKAFEFIPEDLSDNIKVTLTSDSEQTEITSITTGQLTIDAAKLIELSGTGSGTYTNLKFEATLPTPSADRFAILSDIFVVKRIGGFDSSRLQVSENALSVGLPYSYIYPRLTSDANNNAIYIDNWRNSSVADDSEVLTD